MPMKPAAPDRTAPIRKPIAAVPERSSQAAMKTTMPTMAMVLILARQIGLRAFANIACNFLHAACCPDRRQAPTGLPRWHRPPRADRMRLPIKEWSFRSFLQKSRSSLPLRLRIRRLDFLPQKCCNAARRLRGRKRRVKPAKRQKPRCRTKETGSWRSGRRPKQNAISWLRREPAWRCGQAPH